MGRQVFRDGVLVEKWDDATQTYSGPSGSRPYTAAEAAENSPQPTTEADLRAEIEVLRRDLEELTKKVR